MSGHSKWSTIKHKKGAADAKRGKVFTRIIKEMTIAARLGGGDAEGNPRLRAAVAEAKANNMPKDNIERAIKRGTGEIEGVAYEEVTYEGYGPGGVAIIVEALTDNANRTVAEIRHKLSRYGGNLGAANSVSWMFERKGQIYLDAAKYSEDAALEAALDAGAQDFGAEGEQYVVTTEPADMHAVKGALEAKGFVALESEIASVPKNMVRVEGKAAETLVKLLEELEELDDVQKVAANCDVELEEAT